MVLEEVGVNGDKLCAELVHIPRELVEGQDLVFLLTPKRVSDAHAKMRSILKTPGVVEVEAVHDLREQRGWNGLRAVGDVAVVRRLELLAPALDQDVEGVLE